MQKCKSAYGLCKGAKVKREGSSRGDWLAGVSSMEGRGQKCAKVQIGWRPVQRWKGEARGELARGLVGWSIEYGGKEGTWLRRVLLV